MLADAPRPGTRPTFTSAQVVQILAVACEPPSLSGRPITHWTHRELRDEVVKRGIVPTISKSHVGHLLLTAALKPHRRKMWLNTTEKDPVKFQQQVKKVCQTYLNAPGEAAAKGVHTISVDEATGIQALERTAPDKPPRANSPVKQEYEYQRHGTTTLTVGLNIVTGEIVSPTLSPTRTEPEFVQHLADTVKPDPKATYIFVVDNLNTHVSASLVQWVAEQCDVTDDLGKKGFAAC